MMSMSPWISADVPRPLHPTSPLIFPAKNAALQLLSPAWPASATGTKSKWPLNSISVLQHLIMIGWSPVPQTAEAHYRLVSRPVSQLIGSPQSQTADDQWTGLQLLYSPCSFVSSGPWRLIIFMAYALFDGWTDG